MPVRLILPHNAERAEWAGDDPIQWGAGVWPAVGLVRLLQIKVRTI